MVVGHKSYKLTFIGTCKINKFTILITEREIMILFLGVTKQFSTDLPSKNAHTENRTTTCDVQKSVHSDTMYKNNSQEHDIFLWKQAQNENALY